MDRRIALLALLVWLGVAQAQVQAPGRRTYANPIDLDYRYNFEQVNEGISYRTGADPVFVRFGDAYYLFQTLADGYWRSTDLLDWRFVAPSRWPFESIVAPAVVADGERLVIMQSAFEPRPLLQTRDPASGRLEFLTRLLPKLPRAEPIGTEMKRMPLDNVPPGPWDPDLFIDDDGQWYLYWGSSDRYPLYGIAMESAARGVAFRGEPTPLVALDLAKHGWERFGPDHRGARFADGTPIGSYLEGAWMTKVGGRYYLQYAAPGSEYNAYANGVYVGDRPLGPFAYAAYNPVAYKPGGFAQGAGHGSTFQDAHGNWWNSGTAWIGANWTFERRIVLFPAAFAADGQMRVSTRFGDFPHWMPDTAVDDPDSLFAGWMLLSYRKPATASSTLGEFAAARATDEDPRSYWVAARNVAGETLSVDLGAERTVRAVQVNYADYRSDRYGDAADVYTAFRLQRSLDGRHWRPLAEIGNGSERRDRPNAYVQLDAPQRARYVRYVHGHVGAAHLAISDLRVFGNADGAPPPAPTATGVSRDRDRRNATVRWRAVPGAVGYNVRWGIRADRLNLAYQVFADRGTALDIRALDVDQAYVFAVEAFDERGVSALGDTVAAP
ncbi:family 43 glycosylhydrolase [Xanthomonas theicola]|uniref:Coagulation factor 5/8 type domain protein n=1 Tax=Xanthomonas theicola TaxID=56464 RepID=A0A2S6ZDK6_9XANT|nr:family 43 glycosylhydrolase [Xanthomonas theicola]PPT90348.1 coagulation factor 5/8 type domain protein [Xanthomonas theicola]QNH26258.1 family 43 glycosylhydrolase [Xanthomonas theicola]